jgi:HEXXH motif-containing protein
MRGAPAPWSLVGAPVASGSARNDGWISDRLAPVSDEIAACIAEGGLTARASDTTNPQLFAAAAQAIRLAPDLAAIVEHRVKTVHLLAADPGYDVSHSEPVWRDRIFVSVPERSDDIGALRLAESVIHEAMHLHLTLCETETPLVIIGAAYLRSPWRPAPRPAGGVLHGLFVFQCLDAWLARVIPALRGAERTYAAERRMCIADELAQIDRAALEAELTPAGRNLTAHLLA